MPGGPSLALLGESCPSLGLLWIRVRSAEALVGTHPRVFWAAGRDRGDSRRQMLALARPGLLSWEVEQ